VNDPNGNATIGSSTAEGFSPGGILSNARQLRGLSIADVAHALKLAPRQVQAIEADAFDQLRGLTFARGFVRNYARYLGIDPEPLLNGIVSPGVAAQVELAPISNARGEMPTGGSALGSLLPAGMTLAALTALALAGWYFGWFRVPMPTAPTDRMESASSPVREQQMAVAPPAPVETSPPVGAFAGSAAQPAPPASQTAPTPVVAAPPAPEPPVTSAPPAAPGAQRLAFAFEQDSWVEIRDAQGKIVHSQLHKAGSNDDLAVDAKPPYALVIGNAAMVRLRFNDKEVDLAPFIKVTVARLSLQ
jgi:cytoskeleton protein RodZ